MILRTALVLAVVATTAGCFEVPVAWVPASEPVPWQTPGNPLGAARSHGCGFCEGSLEYPEHFVTAWFPEGGTVVIEWGLAANQTEQLQFQGRITADQKALARAIWRELSLPADRTMVHFVATQKLAPVDAREVAWVFDQAGQMGGDAEGEITYTDCGPSGHWLRIDNVLQKQSFGCGIEGGKGWVVAGQQLRILEDWAGK